MIRELGQYRLRRRLGAGGMGEVYLAEHPLLKRPCAVKRIHPKYLDHPEQIRRFEREVQATARLRHPNTVEIYDYGRADDGTFYYVMEYLAGLSLEDLIGRYGPMPADRVVHLLRQVCGALREAHRARADPPRHQAVEHHRAARQHARTTWPSSSTSASCIRRIGPATRTRR